jgi:hypothetical protein
VVTAMKIVGVFGKALMPSLKARIFLVRLSVEQSGLVIRLRGVKNDEKEAHESASR